jgi:hypothetical protein
MTDRFFFNAGKFRFHLHDANLSERKLRFDVQPFGVDQLLIEQVVFRSKKAPRSFAISSDARIGEERWIITWVGSNLQAASLMNEPFCTAVRDGLEAGWLAKTNKHQRELAAWRTTPQRELGNRTPKQIAEMGYGAYEVVGYGFVWFGQEGGDIQFQEQPYFRTESLNRDFRWYLERGVSLAEARRLSRQQQHEVALLAILSFGGVFSGAGAGEVSGSGAVEKAVTLIDQGLNFAGVPTRPAGETFADTFIKMMGNGRNERRIQEVGRRPIKPIATLQPL